MLTEYELKLWENPDVNYIIGIDEVGRGCLAGPMVVAGVILRKSDVINLKNTPENLYSKINDSKKLSAKTREILSNFIITQAESYFIKTIEPEKLDEIGMSEATQLGFLECALNSKIKPDHILTDAFKIKKVPLNIQTNIIKGDQKSISIAAASIIAKVHRDSLMTEYAKLSEYKMYMFEKNKGYGTKVHLEALNLHGPCDLHRKSFSPIKEMLGK